MSDDNNPADKPLNVREKQFVELEVQHPNMDAFNKLNNAGYNPSTANSAKAMQTVLRKRPNIQKAITQRIEERFPDLLFENLEALRNLRDSSNVKENDRINAIKELNKMAGYSAPSRHERLSAHIPVPKLPKE